MATTFPIGLEDLLGHDRYGAARADVRRRVMEHKRRRRVQVGDRMSLLFEDRATVWFQTQEMLWVEHVTDLDAIRDELQAYASLLPGPDELSATLLLEFTDSAQVRDELRRLRGLHRHVWLDVGGERVAGVFEEGREHETKLSAVQYVRFPLAAPVRERLQGGAALAIVVDHPAYRHRATIPEAVRVSVASELGDPTAGGTAMAWVRDG
jgi:hypothetical protein